MLASGAAPSSSRVGGGFRSLPKRTMMSLLLGLALVQRPDSQATLRSARGAQAEFELFRRYHLPAGDGYSGQRGDLHLRRFCFWYGDQTNDSVPEPAAIRDARARLLARLADAAELLPGDDWIAGQRVRYLIEDGRPADAVAVGRGCRGTPWWCATLVGLGLHRAADFAPADSAFAAALLAMPDEERCRWHRVSLLLPGELRTRYDRMSCEERVEFEGHWWWLAAPLLSRPGNDRRTEHFARLTLERIQRDSRTARSDRWGDDMGELLIRFGPEVSWTRKPASPLAPFDPAITGHERVPAFHFVPTTHAFDDPGGATHEDWILADPRPNEWYEPPRRGDVSDLLLLDATDSVARDLASVVRHALPTAQVPVDGRLRLFWEISDLNPAGEPVTTSLSVRAESRAWLGRAAESVGLVGRRRAVELQWDEVLRPDAGVAPRVLDVDLSGLPAGRYRVALAVSVGGGFPVTATREIELVRR